MILSSFSLDLAHMHDVLECELIPLILIKNFRMPSIF
jgi:hypothetical protein